MFGSKKKSLSPSDVYLDDDMSSMEDGTEASIPPPPPPLEKEKRPQSFLRARPAAEGLPRQAYLIEEQDSIEAQDISFWPACWDSYFQSGGAYVFCSRRRRACVALACILVVCVVMGVTIAGNNNQDEGRSSSLAALNNGNGNGNGGPTTADPTSAPTSTPTSTPANGNGNGNANGNGGSENESPETAEPTSSAEPTTCENSVVADQACYGLGATMIIEFINCDALNDDWVGIYEISNGIALDNLPNEVMWLWTCNSQSQNGCEATLSATLPFGGGLPAGSYQAHLVRRNSGGPYASYSGSSSFEISESCPP